MDDEDGGESFKASKQSIIDEINASDSDVWSPEELKKILGSDVQTDPDIAYLEREVARRERIQMQMQKEIHLNEKLLGSQKSEKLKTSKLIQSELIDELDQKGTEPVKYLDKSTSSTAYMLNSSGSSTSASEIQAIEDRDTTLRRNKLLKDLLKLKNTQNDLEMIIEQQRRQIAVENMKLEDALIVNESINNFNQPQRPITPSSTLPPPPPELLEDSDSSDLKFINDRILSGYPTRVTKYTIDPDTNTVKPVKQFIAVPEKKPKVSKVGTEPTPSDMYLETTENLLDEEGNLFSSKKSVKYLGKSLVNKVPDDAKSVVTPRVKAIEAKPPPQEPKIIEMNSNPLSIKVVDNKEVVVKQVSSAGQPSPIRIEMPDSTTIDIIRMPMAPPRNKPSKKKCKASVQEGESGPVGGLTLREIEAIEKVLKEYEPKDHDRKSKYYLNGQEISLDNIRKLKQKSLEDAKTQLLESPSTESVDSSRSKPVESSVYKAHNMEKSVKKKFAPPPPVPSPQKEAKIEPPFRLGSDSESSELFKPVKKAIETETKVAETTRRRALVSPITETETDADVERTFKKVSSPERSVVPLKPILKKPGAKTSDDYKYVKIRKNDPANKSRSNYIMVYPKDCPKSLKSISEEESGSAENESQEDDAIAERILFDKPLDGKCVKCIEIKKAPNANGSTVTKKYVVAEPASKGRTFKKPVAPVAPGGGVSSSNTFPRRTTSMKVSSTGSVRRVASGAQRSYDPELYADEEEARLARTNTNRRMSRYLTRVDWG